MTAFDCSQTAVDWARGLDAGHDDCYVHADLFQPPARWTHRFDLVVDINNLQYLARPMHAEAVAALSRLMTPHGHLLIVCHGIEHGAGPLGPPWPLTSQQLVEAASQAGLMPEGGVSSFVDDQDIPRLRATFSRV